MIDLRKTKEEMIFEILLSLNRGNCKFYGLSNVDVAIAQYEELVQKGIIKEK